MYYNVFYMEHHRFILIDIEPKPKQFIGLLEEVTNFPVEWLSDVKDSLFRVAVLGISREVTVAEIRSEFFYEDRFYLRSKVFRMFCDRIKDNILKQKKDRPIFKWSNYPRLSLILRDGKTRQILNQDELVHSLKKLSVDLRVYTFSQMSLKDQIAAIDQTDILVTMHGAALTHILYMRPDTFVLEMFPYAFRKTIYQNLAQIMGAKYLYWQNTHLSDSVLHWPEIAKNRITYMPKDIVTRLPVDFKNMDSKNYWRNQGFIIPNKRYPCTDTRAFKCAGYGTAFQFNKQIPLVYALGTT